MIRRKTEDPKVAVLRGVSLFSACSDKELAEIASLADEVELPEGRVLCREGRPGAECFVVVSGEARATLRGEELGVLGPGAIIGEMALLDGGPRSATVTAITPMEVLVLEPRSFSGLLARHGTVTRKLLGTLAGRVREVQGGPRV